MRSSLGRLSVVGRWNEARYKRSKRDGNLNKSTFLRLGVLRSFIGSYLVHRTRTIIPSLVRRWSLTVRLNTRYKGIES